LIYRQTRNDRYTLFAAGLRSDDKEMGRTELKTAALTIGVSGASGFLGKNLVETMLRTEGVALKVLYHSAPITVAAERVRCFHGDLVRGDGIDAWISGCDVVVNLAYLWNAGSSNNLIATRNLVDGCVRRGVRRLVHISTAAVVGRACSNWVDEETDCRPKTEYGVNWKLRTYYSKNLSLPSSTS